MPLGELNTHNLSHPWLSNCIAEWFPKPLSLKTKSIPSLFGKGDNGHIDTLRKKTAVNTEGETIVNVGIKGNI